VVRDNGDQGYLSSLSKRYCLNSCSLKERFCSHSWNLTKGETSFPLLESYQGETSFPLLESYQGKTSFPLLESYQGEVRYEPYCSHSWNLTKGIFHC